MSANEDYEDPEYTKMKARKDAILARAGTGKMLSDAQVSPSGVTVSPGGRSELLARIATLEAEVARLTGAVLDRGLELSDLRKDLDYVAEQRNTAQADNKRLRKGLASIVKKHEANGMADWPTTKIARNALEGKK